MKTIQKLALLLTLATITLPLLTTAGYAQDENGPRSYQAGYQNGFSYIETSWSPESGTQRAYDAGFNNGVKDRLRFKPFNLYTTKWHGYNLQAYERGYRDGYRSPARYN